MDLFTGSRAKRSRWPLPILPGDNCTKARWAESWSKYKAGTLPLELSCCQFWSLWVESVLWRCTARSSSEAQSAALGDLRSPRCSAPPSGTPVLSPHRSNLFNSVQKNPEPCEKSRQKIQGRRGRVAEAWSSNFGVGGGQVGSNLVPSFIFTLAWPDPFQIPEQHFSQQSDFFFWEKNFFRFRIVMKL